MDSSHHPHPDLGPGPRRGAPLLLAGERDGPEPVGVPASGGALGVEANLAALEGVDLTDELAIAGQRDVFALEEILRSVAQRFLLSLVNASGTTCR